MKYSEAPGAPATVRLQTWRLLKAIDYMECHLAEPVSLGALAQAAGFTRMHFAKLFRLATGMSPHEYLMRRRVLAAQLLLLDAELGILEIAQAVGFRTQAHFTFVFKRFSGQPPGRWKTAVDEGAA